MTKLLIAAAAAAHVGALLDASGNPMAMNRQDYMHSVSTKKDRVRMGRKDDNEAQIATLQKGLKDVTEALTKRDKDMTDAMAKAKLEIEANGKMAKETLDQLKAIAEGGATLQTRMLEIEQKWVGIQDNMRQNGPKRGKSIGTQVVEDESVIKWLKTRDGSTVKVRLKAITSDTTGSGGAGDLVVPQRISEIIRSPQDRRLTIRQLLTQGRTTSNAIEYVQETGFTNMAAAVAEGAQKPESSLDFQLKTVPVRTIAHWIPVTKQIYDDAPMLASYIDSRMRFGLAIVEENQILAGDGTGQNLLGLIPEAVVYNRPNTGTKLDVLRRSITQVRLSEYRADGVVLHPGDWEEMELLKTDQGAYVWANPMGLLSPTVWGLSVVDTTAIEEGSFLTGAFKMAATVWDREDSNVQISEHDRDNFIKNMLTIRAEERLALTVWRPEALVAGEFAESLDSGQAD